MMGIHRTDANEPTFGQIVLQAFENALELKRLVDTEVLSDPHRVSLEALREAARHQLVLDFDLALALLLREIGVTP